MPILKYLHKIKQAVLTTNTLSRDNGKRLVVFSLFNLCNKVPGLFSFWKQCLFKFGIEILLLILAAASAIITMDPENYKFQSTENRYLTYLAQHSELNREMMDKINTENISVAFQKNLIPEAKAASLDPLLNGAMSATNNQEVSRSEQLPFSSESVIMKPNFATKDALKKRDVQEYVVKNGDSVSKIASNFEISVQTIMYENKLSDADYIKPGQVLTILPTTGIKHAVQAGETISSIAKKYQVDEEIILEFNEIEVPDDIEIGEMLIIPDAKVQIPPAKKSRIASYNYTDVKRVDVNDFIGSAQALIWPLPTRNVTQRFWSRHKGLDISDGGRPQFWAAQSGIVELSGWQGGYGKTIVINHGGGLKTRYAHASELYVTAGDRVERNQVIGRVGNTGRVYGRTGNHLHFEVLQNGVKVDPRPLAK